MTAAASAASDLAIALGGGGARAAYQVGVLRGLARHFPALRPTILTGESAGAINVTYLAAHRGTLAEATDDLADLWSGITADRVFRADTFWLLRNVLRWGLRLLSGGARVAPQVRGLLDTAPLRALLERTLGVAPGRIAGIAEKLQAGQLRAIALTTIDYATGQTVTWVEGDRIRDWERPLRRSITTRLTIDHVLASAALPLLFPAVNLGGRWYGDGGVRLQAPFAPAIHLGAGRILAISTRYRPTAEEAGRPVMVGYPTPAHVAGLLLDAVFLDLIDDDALVLERVNRLLARVPAAQRDGLRHVELLVLRPSRELAEVAVACESCLPRGVRFLTRSLGTRETARPTFLSVMMFAPEYLQPLIRLGEADVQGRLAEIETFLGAPAFTS